MDDLVLSPDPVWLNIAHALVLYLALTLPTAFVIITTQKSPSVRRAWATCVLYILYRFSLQVPSLSTSHFLKGVAGGEAALAALQSLNLLLITNLDETELVHAKLYSPSASLPSRLLRTWALLLNFRGVGTAWEVKNVPQHPAYLRQRLSRKRYVLRESVIIVWQYLLLDVIYMSIRDTSPEDVARSFGHGLEFKYFDATFEQWMGRISTGIFAWLVPCRVCIDIVPRIYFLILVVLGISSPNSCRPGFGRLRDAYTIRGFWGTFWQQFFRWPLTSVSTYLARDVLRLPSHSLLERYTNLFFSFFTSGVLHLICDSMLGVPPSGSGALMFFCSLPLGIMIEDGVEAIWSRVTGPNEGVVPFWHRLVGFLWVGLWMSLTSPWYLYPSARKHPHEHWMVPVGVVERIGLGAAQKILLGYGLLLYWGVGGEVF